ncbi:hypothetical protein [Streptomyces cellulosae]|uniref:Tn3 transposase DDE domain-containing protein n=1 Tax=Streptomyces cellulosae TaxID=1968 RepID=A0ABW7Y9P9_STRCE
MLGQAAISACRTKDTYLAVRYRRLVARRFLEGAGKTRATRRLVSQLNRLGDQVNLHPVEAT